MRTACTDSTPADKPFSVNLWGSAPGGNDDCWTGDSFATLPEALAVAADWMMYFDVCVDYAAFIEIDGPGYYEARKNLAYRPSRDDDGEWKRERAMQAGMSFGVDGYNDEMGW